MHGDSALGMDSVRNAFGTAGVTRDEGTGARVRVLKGVERNRGNSTLDSVAVYDSEVVGRHTGLNGGWWHNLFITSANCGHITAWLIYLLHPNLSLSADDRIRDSNNPFHGTEVVTQQPHPRPESLVVVHWILVNLLAVHRRHDVEGARGMCDTDDLCQVVQGWGWLVHRCRQGGEMRKEIAHELDQPSDLLYQAPNAFLT